MARVPRISNKLRIRTATAADRSQLAALQLASWQDTYIDILPAGYLAHGLAADLERHWRGVKILADDVVLVAEDSRISGFICIWVRPLPFIDNLHVNPELRSQGLGRKLMSAAAAYLIARGHETAHLVVYAKNHRAIEFYQRLGGQITGTAEKALYGHPMPVVEMTWDNLKTIADPANFPVRN